MRPSVHVPSVRSLLLGALFAGQAVFALSPADLAARLGRNENLLVIDVRSSMAYANGHVPGAMNIPLSLLPHKPLPSGSAVVVYGDGLGVVDDAQALTVIRAKPGVSGEVLEGGYAAWLADTRLSTVPAGVTPERLPGITYDQLVVAGKSDMVLVDLRPSATPAPAAAGTSRIAASAPDLVSAFATKIGVPVVTPNGPVAGAAAKAQTSAVATAAAPARAAAPAAEGGNSGRLLVLVADDEAQANEAARQLRASGQYRFTILIGGTTAIVNEGRIGSGRMDGATPAAAKR